jgi:Mce-associated membrane protein
VTDEEPAQRAELDEIGAAEFVVESDVDDTGQDLTEVNIEDVSTPAKPAAGLSLDRVAFVMLPAVALLLAAGAGYLKWEYASRQDSQRAAAESVTAAADTAAAILSYRPDSVDKELSAARDRLTGSFLESYTTLVNDVVIPGAKQKKITAVAQVPAAASVSATPSHAVVLVFVNQATTIGNDPTTNTASSVRVTLDKIGDRWLVSGFDPI